MAGTYENDTNKTARIPYQQIVGMARKMLVGAGIIPTKYQQFFCVEEF
jgi:hypothetical protein